MLNLFSSGFFRRIALQRTSGSTRGGEVSPGVCHSKNTAVCQKGIISCADAVALAWINMRDVNITYLLNLTKIIWPGGRTAFQSREAVAGRSKSLGFYMAILLAKKFSCGSVFTQWAHSLICQTVIMPILIIHNESVMQSKTWPPGRY